MGDYNTMSYKGIRKRSLAKELGRGYLYTDIVANGVSRELYYADIAIFCKTPFGQCPRPESHCSFM